MMDKDQENNFIDYNTLSSETFRLHQCKLYFYRLTEWNKRIFSYILLNLCWYRAYCNRSGLPLCCYSLIWQEYWIRKLNLRDWMNCNFMTIIPQFLSLLVICILMWNIESATDWTTICVLPLWNKQMLCVKVPVLRVDGIIKCQYNHLWNLKHTNNCIENKESTK